MRRESDPLLGVVAVLLEPVARFARLAGLTLDDLVDLTTHAYFREYRSRDLSVPQIAKRFDKSERTVASIKKRAESRYPLQPSARMELRRKLILEINRAHGVTREKLLARFKASHELLAIELERLLEDRRVREERGKLVVADAYVRLQRDDLSTRLDGVRHFLNALEQTLYRRFATGDEGVAMAKVFTFPATRAALTKLAEETLRDALARAGDVDRAAQADGCEAVDASIAFCVVENTSKAPFVHDKHQ